MAGNDLSTPLAAQCGKVTTSASRSRAFTPPPPFSAQEFTGPSQTSASVPPLLMIWRGTAPPVHFTGGGRCASALPAVATSSAAIPRTANNLPRRVRGFRPHLDEPVTGMDIAGASLGRITKAHVIVSYTFQCGNGIANAAIDAAPDDRSPCEMTGLRRQEEAKRLFA